MQTLGDIVQIGLIVLGVYAFGRVLWRAWIRPMFARPDRPAPIDRHVAPHARWSLRDELARLFLIQGDIVMSSAGGDAAADAAIAAPVAATSTDERQPIATPGNAGNTGLSGNAVAGPIPPEARDIIRMQAKAEVVVALLKSAKLTNKAEAIELVFNCSRSGRPNSVYQQALALVDPLTDRYPQRTPEQEQSRRDLELA